MVEKIETTTTMLVNPILLRWARKTLGLSEQQAATKLKIDIGKLVAWENGEEEVPITKIRLLSKVYKRPSVVFLLDKEPSEKIPAKFRKLIDFHTGEFTSDTILAIRKAARVQNISKDVFGSNDSKFISRLRRLSNLTNYEKIGNKILNLLEVDFNEVTRHKNAFEQLNYWKKTIESKGVYVLELGFPTDEAKGFAIYDDAAPVIVLNTNDYPNPRIFTLIHELVHFVLGKDVISNEGNILNFQSNDKTEIFCNYIAGSILIPADLLDQKLQTLNLNFRNFDTDLEILGKVFNVSREVVLRRLLISNKISKRVFELHNHKFRDNYKEKPKAKGGNFYIKYLKNNSRSFVENILDAYRVNRINYSETLDYLSIKSETLTKLEARL